jgi:hypothetical protein
MFGPDLSAGAVVPAVTPSDLDAVVKLMLDFEKEHDGGAIGLNVYQAACSPGADVGAVWFRATILCLALRHGEFAEFVEAGVIKGSLLRLWAAFPFKAVDVQQDGSFQLNGTEFGDALRNMDNE